MSGPDYSRSRERADAIRAQLEPLGPDERPLGLKLAVALAVFIAVANVVGAVAGVGSESPVVAIVFAALMGVLARAMWDRRYLAVVAFEGLLALTIIVSTLSLAFAGNLLAVIVCVVAIVVCAPIFWLLIRVMARMQVPSQ